MKFRIRLLLSLATSCLLCSNAGAENLVYGQTRVGPFFPQGPHGITWVLGDRLAYQVTLELVDQGALIAKKEKHRGWRPLAAATDSSYYAMEWKTSGATVRLRWAAEPNGQIVATAEADQPAQVILTSLPTWPNVPALSYRQTTDGLICPATQDQPGWWLRSLTPSVGHGAAPDLKALETVLLKPGQATAPREEGPCAGLLVEIKPGAPLKFAAGLGSIAPTTPSEVDSKLAAAAKRYEANKGNSREAQCMEGIRVAMNVNRMYSPYRKTMAYSVSRWWCMPGLIRLFCWDSFFNGLLAMRFDPVTAKDTVRGILAAATPEGFIPNAADDTQPRSMDRSQPPVAAMAIWRMHQLQPDKAFLEDAYPKLVRWHQWWFEVNPKTGKPNRDGNSNGLLEWGANTGFAQNIRWESGMDDSPLWDEMEVDVTAKTMKQDAVDLNSLYAMDAEYLAKIAEAIGRTEEARNFEKEHQAMNSRINELLWNPAAGIYSDRYWEKRLETYKLSSELIPASSFKRPDGANGFQVEYFVGRQFKNPVETGMVDKMTLPGRNKLAQPLLGKDGFAVRWSSKLVPERTGRYALSFNDRSNLRLWLNGKIVIEQRGGLMSPPLRTAPIALEAGKTYDLKVELLEPKGNGWKLVWYPVPENAPADSWFSSRYGCTNFYPMLSGAPDAARAKELIAIIQDPKRLWGEYVVPTISRDDPAFEGQDYWRGKIWGPTNYLFWVGLQRYAGPELLSSYAQKSEELFVRTWLATGRCHENYFCTGEGGSDPVYTWGALLGLIGQEWREAQAKH